ncbi:MAG TPA: hypothetical protein VGI45_13840, partial [Terracidiphilus sp.]
PNFGMKRHGAERRLGAGCVCGWDGPVTTEMLPGIFGVEEAERDCTCCTLVFGTGNFCRCNARFGSAYETGGGWGGVSDLTAAEYDGTSVADEVRVNIASGTSLIARTMETAATHAYAASLLAGYCSLGGDTIARTLVASKDGEDRKSIGPANPSPESRQLAKVVRQAAYSRRHASERSTEPSSQTSSRSQRK